MKKKSCIIIPCFNEANRLPLNLFEEFIASVSGVDFLFVNDGSYDNTRDLLVEFVKMNPNRFFFLNIDINAGKAAAVRAGMLFLANRSYDYLGYWDADLATPLSEISRFVEIAEQYPSLKIVLGMRLARLGSRIERKWYRHYLGRVFATMASLILQLPVYDTQCGAKLMAVDVVRDIFSKPFVSNWFFDVELLFRLLQSSSYTLNRDIFHEVPLLIWRDVRGSKLKLRDFCRAPWELLRIFFHYRINKYFANGLDNSKTV